MHRRFFAATVLALSAPLPVAGQGILEDIWGLAEWYSDDSNPTIQSFVFGGRFQLDRATAEDNSGYDETNVRRMRMGVEAQLFNELTISVEADVNPQERDPFYLRLTDAYVGWAPRGDVEIRVGKHSAPFTTDGATSSTRLLTMDRNNVSNNMWFTSEYMPGVSVQGDREAWSYHAGVYSSGMRNGEFGDFSGSAFVLLSLGRDFGVGGADATLRGDFVVQGDNPNNDATRSLGQVRSLNFQLDGEGWGVRTDVTSGAGYQGQSDLWGTMVMPYVSVTEDVQLVSRYTHVESDGMNGVRLARYESRHTSGRGDNYDEFYLGLNYYIYGNNLKLQGGMKLANMEDVAQDGGGYNGVAFTAGLRMSW